MTRYIPFESATTYHEISLKNLNDRFARAKKYGKVENSFYHDADFVCVDGKCYVNKSIGAPLRSKVEDLYFKAIPTAKGSDHELATQLCKLDPTMKHDTVYHFLHRFTIQKLDVRQRYIELLEKYCSFIENNTLFGEDIYKVLEA